MKVAKVRYVGSMRSQHYRLDSGERVRFSRTDWLSFDDIEVVREFVEEPAYEVEWTSRGKLLNEFYDEGREITDALTNLAYRQKQKLAKELGIKANQSEEELKEELEEEVEKLAEEI